MDKEQLENIVDSEKAANIEETDRLEDLEQQRRLENRSGTWKAVTYAVIMVAILVTTLIVYIASQDGIPKDKKSVYMGTKFSVSTYTDDFVYAPLHVTTNLGKFNTEFDIDLSDSKVMAFDNYNNYSYIVYTSEDSNLYTEIVVTDTIPDGLNLDEEDLNQLENEKEIIKIIDDEKISTELAIKELYNLGYLIVKQQANIASKATTFASKLIQTIDECMIYSSNKDLVPEDKKLYIEIEGIGLLDLNELSIANGAAGVYFGQDNTLRVYNYEENKVYAYMTNMNNRYMMNNYGNMEQAEGWNNLYYDKDKDDIEKMGYRAFGVQTSKGFYYIKVDEKAPKGLEEEIIDWLGIKPEDTKIEAYQG